MSEHAKYSSAQTTKSRGSSEYSAVAVGGALVFGAVVGLAGVSLVHHTSSPLSGSSSDLGLTSTRSVKKNVDFDTGGFEFNHCLQGDFTPPDKTYSGWSSDGSAARKLDSMKQEVLLDPIGVTTDASGKSVKYYDQEYSFKDADGDGAPLAETRAAIETIKQEALTTCVNPLPGIQADGLLSETSKACSSEISAAAAKVYEDYKACKKISEGIEAKLNDYSAWSGVEYQLQTDRDNLLKLYNDRKAAGKKYDKDFEKWLAAHNDALAACAYASNYQVLSANVDKGFIQLLQTEKTTIGAHCENIPSMNQFQVKNIGITSRRALLESDSKTCESILESMQGVSDSEKFEHDGRANCLEFYCESAAVTKDPAARGVAEASLEAYDALDAEFAAALAKFNANHQTFMEFNAAINKNSALVIQARDEVVGQQNVTDTSKAKLLHYLACPSSSICCQAPEDVPKICAEDAAGTVAKFAAPAEFTLRSPPPPPSPPPIPSPPPAFDQGCPGGKFYIRMTNPYRANNYCSLHSNNIIACDQGVNGYKNIFEVDGEGFMTNGGADKYCTGSNSPFSDPYFTCGNNYPTQGDVQIKQISGGHFKMVMPSTGNHCGAQAATNDDSGSGVSIVCNKGGYGGWDNQYDMECVR